MALETEMDTYQRELPSLLGEEGKFALIRGDRIIDIYGTYEDALKAGYREAGLEMFMVKQIHAIEQVQYITKELCPVNSSNHAARPAA